MASCFSAIEMLHFPQKKVRPLHLQEKVHLMGGQGHHDGMLVRRLMKKVFSSIIAFASSLISHPVMCGVHSGQQDNGEWAFTIVELGTSTCMDGDMFPVNFSNTILNIFGSPLHWPSTPLFQEMACPVFIEIMHTSDLSYVLQIVQRQKQTNKQNKQKSNLTFNHVTCNPETLNACKLIYIFNLSNNWYLNAQHIDWYNTSFHLGGGHGILFYWKSKALLNIIYLNIWYTYLKYAVWEIISTVSEYINLPSI